MELNKKIGIPWFDGTDEDTEQDRLDYAAELEQIIKDGAEKARRKKDEELNTQIKSYARLLGIQILPLDIRVLDHPAFRKDTIKVFGLLVYLMCRVVRAEMKNDLRNIYRDYYIKQGKLAYSAPVEVIANDLGIHKDTVSKYIKILKKWNALKVEPQRAACRTRKGLKWLPYHVYVLGHLDDNGHEKWLVNLLVRELYQPSPSSHPKKPDVE